MNSKSSAPKKRFYGALGILWMLIVLIGYFYTHKPFTPDEFLSMLFSLWRVIVVFFIISLSGGIGYKILKGSKDQAVSHMVEQTALGLGILGILILLIGVSIGFNLWLVLSFFLLSGFFIRKSIAGWWKSWVGLKDAWNRSGNYGRTSAIFAFLILMTTFLISLAPPLEFDALTYHLSIPRTYLIEGRITYLPENMFWGMPQLIEMLHTLAMEMGGSEAATLLGWSLGFLTLVGIFSFTWERIGINGAWAALACLLVGQTFTASLAWGYVEWPSMLFATAMIFALDHWFGNSKPTNIILAGFFAGFALSTKYSAGILLLAGIVIISTQSKYLGWRITFQTLLIFGFSAVLVFSPWLVKNALATGNPVYPLMFTSGGMDQIRLDFYQKPPNPRPLIEMFLLPWQATIWGVERKVGFSASIGPLFLGLSLLAGIGWRDRIRSEKMTIMIVGYLTVTCLIIWALVSQNFEYLIQSRLFFSFFPAWAILGGVGFSAIEKISVEKIRFGRIISVLVLLVFSFSVFETGVNTPYLAAVNVISNHQSSDEYVKDHLGWYGPAMQAIRELPEGSRVLMLWETRSLYCLPKCDPDEVIDRWFHDIRKFGTADEIIKSWREQGYTHLLISHDGELFVRRSDSRFSMDDWQQLDILVGELNQAINFGDSYLLYSLQSP